MLKFFRTIRKKLIEQDNIRKYLLYAIGEILLVVIGILIALQVNNWNEERKDKLKETALVSQLHSDLLQTEEELTEIKEFFHSRAHAAALVTKSYWKNEMLRDTLLVNFGIVGSNRRYNPILGTARSLISSGNIDLIPSDNVRKGVVTYTETMDALMKDVIRFEETYYRSAQELLVEEYDTWNLIATYLKEDMASRWPADPVNNLHPFPEEFDAPPFPVKIENIYANRKVYTAFSNFLIAHRNTFFIYENMEIKNRELLALLEEEGYTF